jgi:hypothetical protein
MAHVNPDHPKIGTLLAQVTIVSVAGQTPTSSLPPNPKEGDLFLNEGDKHAWVYGPRRTPCPAPTPAWAGTSWSTGSESDPLCQDREDCLRATCSSTTQAAARR